MLGWHKRARLLTTLGMAAYQIATRRNAFDLRLLVGFFLLQSDCFTVGHVLFLDAIGNCVWQGTRTALLQNNGLVAIFRVEGNQVSPDAFANLILNVVRDGRVAVDKLAERLSVLRGRGQRLSLGEGVFGLLWSDFLLALSRRGDGGLLGQITGVLGGMCDGGREMLLIDDRSLVWRAGGQVFGSARLLVLGLVLW